MLQVLVIWLLIFFGGRWGKQEREVRGTGAEWRGMLGNLWEGGNGKLETRSELRQLNLVPSSALPAVCPLFKSKLFSLQKYSSYSKVRRGREYYGRSP